MRARPVTIKLPIQAAANGDRSASRRKDSIGVNVKVFFEGEEEAGSPHLEEAFQRRDLLKGDMWVLSDGPVNQTRRMQLILARGA